MGFNLIEHYRNLSQYLAAQYRLSSSYGHHGSKGQLREDILMTTLQEMAHDFVKLCKGEICDSTGRRSVEFDIIISYISSALRLFSTATNQVIPIESVLAVLEVKSILAKESITTFNSNLANLNTFDRYYVPTIFYQHTEDMAGTKKYTSFLGRPIKPSENIAGITRILGGIFAFNAPAPDTVKTWLADVTTETNFAFICVLGKFFAYPERRLGQWHITEKGQDTFALFASVFLQLADSDEREVHVKADSHRYIDMAVQAAQL
jgi:hypothetical protein